MLRPIALALALGPLLLGCLNLDLVEPRERPKIRAFEPAVVFSGDELTVWAENLDPVGNQLLFPGGATVVAQTSDGTGFKDLIVDRPLPGTLAPLYPSVTFIVPAGFRETGRLVLSNVSGQSEPSAADCTPLGVGFPSLGTQVAQVRFRHDPVGLVDTEENVLMASSLFDLLVTDGRAKYVAPGKPLALRASPNSPQQGRSLLSVATESGAGVMVEVQTIDGQETARSDELDYRELMLLPPADASSLARSVGVDRQGRWALSTWTFEGAKLVPLRRPLAVAEVMGASAEGPLVALVVRLTAVSTPTIWSVIGSSQEAEWNPRLSMPAACAQDPALCELPDGPIAVVNMPPPVLDDGGVGATPRPRVAVSVESGDLVVLQDLKIQGGQVSGARAEALTLISYAPIEALAASVAPGKVVFTKALDGALFQYDLETAEADWAVQLRGEPSIIDVVPGIDEVAVGNRVDNAVDIVRASTGTWIGRVAFNLGVGSANRTLGGVVAPYTYDPRAYEGGAPPLERMDLLMRNVGLVVSIDASSLEVLDHVRLEDPDVHGRPLRLFVNTALQTVVVHEGALFVLDEDADGVRTPRRVATFEPGFLPEAVSELPTGELLVGTVSNRTGTNAVRAFRWMGRALAPLGEFQLPAGAKLLALGGSGAEALLFWQRTSGAFEGGFFRPADFANANPQPTRALSFDSKLRDFIGLVPLLDGPALLFGGRASLGPWALDVDDLRTDGEGFSSIITGRTVAGASPNGRYALWLDEQSVEPMARLVDASSREGYQSFSTYRLSGLAAGPAFDPSGEWLYLPVPLLDQLDVVQ